MVAPLDQPKLPDQTSEFENLREFLRTNLGECGDTIELAQFPSGFSNLTFLVTCGEKELVIRRPPIGANIKSAHDMSREFKVLSLLKPIYPNVPDPIIYCDDLDVWGAPFYVMERIKGVILRRTPPESLQLTPDLMKGISKACVDHLVSLHQLPLTSDLEDLGKPEGYIQRQVEGWIGRYYKAETDMVEAMDFTAEWLRAQHVTYDDPAFIHNDFKYDNLVLDPKNITKILAVLDWEMATVGDPLMDLGTTLGYWVEQDDPDAMKHNLTWLPGNLTREEVAARYVDKTGKSMENILFYYVFGLFKIGVIVQQIYARYVKESQKTPLWSVDICTERVCRKCAESHPIESNKSFK